VPGLVVIQRGALLVVQEIQVSGSFDIGKEGIAPGKTISLT
jgi:hypothetical protein